ncbi:MAG: ABC transporter permease [Gammaproteobacteria bacterium]|tara:strand:+ start:4310 stop:5518 length:1209 start_codon:yes stop_codon:yes gene_type:complete
MSKWQVLLIKEIKHLFRDTKTIVQTVILPTFITPALLGAIFWYVGSIANEETKKTYDISAYSTIESNLITQLADSDRLNILSEESIDDVITSVTEGNTEIGLVLDESFSENLATNNSAKITIYSKNIDTFSQAKSLVTNIIDDFEDTERNERLLALNLTNEYVNPIIIDEEDLTTEEESAGSIFGAILALFFVMYVMSGSTYPAVDLGAGEKERGTMETLISTNISSVDIIIGKMLSVTTSAVLTATFSMLGFAIPMIVIFLFYADSVNEYLFSLLSALLNPVAFLAVFILIIPLSVFMGAFLLAISVYAKTPKEAGLLLGNVLIIFIVPCYIPLINPGLELDFVGALIPCYNLALLTNNLIAGTVDWFLYTVSFVSTIVYCCIAIYVTYIMFDDENVIFRS